MTRGMGQHLRSFSKGGKKNGTLTGSPSWLQANFIASANIWEPDAASTKGLPAPLSLTSPLSCPILFG